MRNLFGSWDSVSLQESLGSDAYDICRGRHRGNDESEEAHEKVMHSKKDMQHILWAQVAIYGPITCQELSEKTGIAYTTCSARLSELKRDGRLWKVGTRKTRSGASAALLSITKPPG